MVYNNFTESLTMPKILDELNKELDKLAKDPNNIKDYSRFEKNKTKKLGFISLLLRKISAKYFQQIKALEKKEIFSLCEKLLKSRKMGKKSHCFWLGF